MVWALGLNYAKHAAEAQLAPPKYPVVILKPPTAVTAPHGAICIPKCAADPPEVDYEVELAVVIGRACKDVLPEDALQVLYRSHPQHPHCVNTLCCTVTVHASLHCNCVL